ncbi:ras guanine nucleotide exchange factor domain-containing protein [Irpex lacteus]|nr:ras guanine nucleotide exchange factor domain-containing protein [Irpex lacteus]
MMNVNPQHDALKRAHPGHSKANNRPKHDTIASFSTRVKVDNASAHSVPAQVERPIPMLQPNELERAQRDAASVQPPLLPTPRAVQLLTHAFPRPARELIEEPDTIEFEPTVFFTHIGRGAIPHPINFKIVEAYYEARQRCSLAWVKKVKDMVKDSTPEFIAASKALRGELLVLTMSGWMEIHVKVAVQNLEFWESLLESHLDKLMLRDAMTANARKIYWKFGGYLLARLEDANQNLADTLGFEIELGRASMERLLAHIKIIGPRIEKPGFFARAVEQAVAHFKDAAKAQAASKKVAKVEIADPAQYPTRATTTAAKPKVPPTPAPEYFDECTDESLTELSINLRAACVAFHLVFKHHEATGVVLPVGPSGKKLDHPSLLREANLPTLVRYLTDHFESRDEDVIELMDAFFRFFRFLIKPLALLKLLTDRYQETPPEHWSDADRLEWSAEHVFTKLFIVRMISRWLECYYIHSEDRIIRNDVNRFVRGLVVKDEDLPPSAAKLITLELLECDSGRRGVTYAPVLERVIAEGKKNIKEYPETAFTKYLVALDTLKKDRETEGADILLFHHEGGAEELARTLTRRAAVGLQYMVPANLLFYKSRGEAPWLKDCSSFSQMLTMWVLQSILSQLSPQNRAKAHEVLIEVAWICLRMRNFMCAFSMTIALSQNCLLRLSKTRKYISPAHKKRFRLLNEFFGSDNNKEYTKAIRSNIAPTIPNTVIVETQLDKISGGQGFRNSIINAKDGVTPIRFGVLRSLGTVVKDVERCYIPHEVPVHELIEDWVFSTLLPFEGRDIIRFKEEMDRLSLKLEPDAIPAATNHDKSDPRYVNIPTPVGPPPKRPLRPDEARLQAHAQAYPPPPSVQPSHPGVAQAPPPSVRASHRETTQAPPRQVRHSRTQSSQAPPAPSQPPRKH